jgi:hypothetical protein
LLFLKRLSILFKRVIFINHNQSKRWTMKKLGLACAVLLVMANVAFAQTKEREASNDVSPMASCTRSLKYTINTALNGATGDGLSNITSIVQVLNRSKGDESVEVRFYSYSGQLMCTATGQVQETAGGISSLVVFGSQNITSPLYVDIPGVDSIGDPCPKFVDSSGSGYAEVWTCNQDGLTSLLQIDAFLYDSQNRNLTPVRVTKKKTPTIGD